VERVKGYQQTFAYQKAMNKRKVWVEPLFGEGKQWHGMRRFRLRRLWRVNGFALMIASGQNLKRLLQKRGWGRRPFPTEAVALRPPGDEEADVFSKNISLKNDRVSVAVASLVSYEVVRAFFEAQSSRFSLRNSTFVIFLWPFKYPFFPFYCFSYSSFPIQGKALQSQAHIFSYKLSKEFFNRLGPISDTCFVLSSNLPQSVYIWYDDKRCITSQIECAKTSLFTKHCSGQDERNTLEYGKTAEKGRYSTAMAGNFRPVAACVIPGRSRWKSHQSVGDGVVLCQG
jgi:hypothetical protein